MARFGTSPGPGRARRGDPRAEERARGGDKGRTRRAERRRGRHRDRERGADACVAVATWARRKRSASIDVSCRQLARRFPFSVATRGSRLPARDCGANNFVQTTAAIVVGGAKPRTPTLRETLRACRGILRPARWRRPSPMRTSREPPTRVSSSSWRRRRWRPPRWARATRSSTATTTRISFAATARTPRTTAPTSCTRSSWRSWTAH